MRTKSGALAVRDRLSGEVMHPVTGPWVEALDVYVTPSRLAERLEASDPRPLVVLDAGLGAGTNALCAWRTAQALQAPRRTLAILSIDHSLDAFELAQRPEYAAAFGWDSEVSPAMGSLRAHGRYKTDRIDWQIEIGDLNERLAQQPESSVDIVYWDPFSASSCPALWTLATFSQLRRVCRPGATVHTFCTSTPARAALLLAGFFVGEGARTGNGRATTLAAVDKRDVETLLGPRFLARVQRSSAPFPSDVKSDAMQRLLELVQLRT